MIVVFNILFTLFFLLGVGCYWVLYHQTLIFKEVLKSISSSRDKEIIKTIRDNSNKVERVLYIIYLFLLFPFCVLNKWNINTLLFLFILTVIFSLITPLRNLISNLAMIMIFKRKMLIKFLVKK